MSNYSQTIKSKDLKLFDKSKPHLSKLDIELTERCNNNCIHCCINQPQDDEDARHRELGTAQIKRLVDEAAELGCMTIRYTGGEPLLREDFNELYLYTRKKGIKVIVFTNATLIDQDLIDLWLKYPPGVVIEVTVYGMTRETYESVSRVKGTFDAAFRGIHLLLDNNIPFVVKQPWLPQTQNQREQFEAWAATIPWMENNPPRYSYYFDLRGRRDSESANERIRSLRPSVKEGVDFNMRYPEVHIKEMQRFCDKFMKPPGDRLFSCGAGVNGGTIDAYGWFQMCMTVRHPEFTVDVREGGLRKALEEVFPRLRETRATNPEFLNRCAKCFLKGLCEQCPGKSWAETGTLDTPIDYLCDVAHEHARRLGLLKDGEQGWTVEDWRGRIDEFVKKDVDEIKQNLPRNVLCGYEN